MTVTIIRAVIIYLAVIIAVRVMGKRQLGELSNHEFVITILISAVATIPLEENSVPLANSLLPILIFISLEILESALSMKSQRFSGLLEGKPIFIIRDGVIQQAELKRLRLTVSDILDTLRSQGIFDIQRVKNAIVETNGRLSVQTTEDGEALPIPVILDGKTVTEYFGDKTIPKESIERALKEAERNQTELLLMTIDKDGKIAVIEKEKQ